MGAFIRQSFGVRVGGDVHKWLVMIPQRADSIVRIVEDYGLVDEALVERAHLDRARWDAIAGAVAVEFNARLGRGRRGRWRRGLVWNAVERIHGKELCVLAWAVEHTELAAIPRAIERWLALRPEERWWLFTATAAASGRAEDDAGRGWRRALRHALSDRVS